MHIHMTSSSLFFSMYTYIFI